MIDIIHKMWWLLLFLGLKICFSKCYLQAQNLFCSNMQLVNENGEVYMPSHFNENRIVIFNRPPQCHECEEMIYCFCKKINVGKEQLLIILGPHGNMFSMQQLKQTANLILQDNYIPLYYVEASEAKTAFQSNLKTPILLLLSSDGVVTEEFTIDHVLSKNLYDKTINKQVQKTIRRFLK